MTIKIEKKEKEQPLIHNDGDGYLYGLNEVGKDYVPQEGDTLISRGGKRFLVGEPIRLDNE